MLIDVKSSSATLAKENSIILSSIWDPVEAVVVSDISIWIVDIIYFTDQLITWHIVQIGDFWHIIKFGDTPLLSVKRFD